jgi:hypothetical protein
MNGGSMNGGSTNRGSTVNSGVVVLAPDALVKKSHKKCGTNHVL